ncbi:MAG: VOC family protein [Bacteroidota bacterium]
MKLNPVVWFEIPVTQLERAKAFYDTVFGIDIKIVELGGPRMGWFPNEEGAAGATGSLMEYESYVPSHEGTLVYLSCHDLQEQLDRVEAAGGKILHSKSLIAPEHGYMGVMEDTEGNRVALHSVK